MKAFDELPHFTQTQYRYLIAWNRTVIPGQRCRVVAAGNPPVPGQGEWVIQEWAPWLDPQYPDPAAPGELRWYVMLNGELHWVPGPEPVQHGDETLQPRSRTFISARVEDNPALMATGYKARLQALPEPLRSQLLYGDFAAGAADDPWQVIPTAWVRLAMQRWRDAGGEHHRPELPLGCLGVDVSRGGQDKTVLAPRHGVWFAPLAKHKGEATSTGPKVAGLVMGALGESAAPVNIDCLSVGTSPLDFLRENGVYVSAINFGAAARDYAGDYLTDRSGRYRFRNVRAAAYWRLREALDPDNGEGLMLPDDRELLGDLCAQRYTLSAGGITLEDKDAVRERLGRSPDCSDAVALALWQDQSMDPLLGVVSVGSAKGWSPRV